MPSGTFRFASIKTTLTGNILEEVVRTGEIVGSWWLTVAVLLALGWLSHLTIKASTGFYCILTLAIVISMVVTAPLIYLLNHHISDEIFEGNYYRVPELLAGAIASAIIISFLPCLFLVFSFSHLPLNLKILTCSLTVSISLIWITGSVMSAIEKEDICLVGFVLGAVICLPPGYFLRLHPSISVLIIVATVFFCFTAIFHYAYVLKALSNGLIRPSFDFLSSKYLTEGFNAFFLTLGIWVDKIIFWFHPKTAIALDPLLRYSNYDYPFFIAFTIASIGQFLVLRNHSQLRDVYKAYIAGLRHNYNFSFLHFTKLRIISEWQKSIYRLVYIYGFMIMAILLSIVTDIVSLPWKNPFVFHYLLSGTLFFMLFSFNILMFQYFLQHKVYLCLSLVFLVSNTVGSLISIEKGPAFYGTGFLGSSLLSALISTLLLSPLLSRLEYQTFREVADVF